VHPLTIARTAIGEHAAIQKEQELAAYLAIVMDLEPLDTIVEVGAFAGGTLWAWHQLGARVIGVDMPPPGYPDGPQVNDLGMTVICGDSHHPDTRDQLLKELDGAPVDMLFIDGDHTYEGVKADWELYAPLVRPGGVIGFHDICLHAEMPFIEVNRFWFTLDGDKEELVAWPPTWGGIGVIRAEDRTEAAENRERLLADYRRSQALTYHNPNKKFQKAR
jgi:predicted O-methyltransferase YrrM